MFKIKDKKGNSYTTKEFLVKFKKGVEGITPLQQVKMSIKGTNVVLLGIFCGMIACGFAIKTLWWLEIILGASFFNTYIGLIGLKQKKRALEQFEKFSLPVQTTSERGLN